MSATKLILGKLGRGLSKKEEKDFEKWIGESDENKFMFFRLETLKKNSDDFSDLTCLCPQHGWMKVKQKVEEKRNQKNNVFGLAGIFKYTANKYVLQSKVIKLYFS